MKKYAIFLSSLLVTLFACSDKNDPTDDAPSVTEPKLFVSVSNLALSASEGSSSNFKITSNSSWTIESSAPWIKLSKKSGKGNSEIEVTATEMNKSEKIRTDSLVVKCDTLKKTVVVTQVIKKGTYMMLTLISPEKDLKSADFIMTTVADNGEKKETMITKDDFKPVEGDYVSYVIDGSSQFGIKEGDQCWQYKMLPDQFKESSTFFVQYKVKQNNIFSSTAGFSVCTLDEMRKIDSYSQMFLLMSSYININTGGESDESAKVMFWFGYHVDVDDNGTISVKQLSKDDILM